MSWQNTTLSVTEITSDRNPQACVIIDVFPNLLTFQNEQTSIYSLRIE